MTGPEIYEDCNPSTLQVKARFFKATFPPNISTIIERKKGGPPGAILDRSSVQNRSCEVRFQIRPLTRCSTPLCVPRTFLDLATTRILRDEY